MTKKYLMNLDNNNKIAIKNTKKKRNMCFKKIHNEIRFSET